MTVCLCMDMNDSDERGQLTPGAMSLKGWDPVHRWRTGCRQQRSLRLMYVGMEAGSMQMGAGEPENSNLLQKIEGHVINLRVRMRRGWVRELKVLPQ